MDRHSPSRRAGDSASMHSTQPTSRLAISSSRRHRRTSSEDQSAAAAPDQQQRHPSRPRAPSQAAALPSLDAPATAPAPSRSRAPSHSHSASGTYVLPVASPAPAVPLPYFAADKTSRTPPGGSTKPRPARAGSAAAATAAAEAAAAAAAAAGEGADSSPEAAAEAELMVLPAIEAPEWENLVHCVVWNVGRHFGFQAFNVNPSTRSHKRPQWVPATMIVAGDHLASLIRNKLMRDKISQSEEERFARAVFELHATIFMSYDSRWCTLLKLPPRPKQLEDALSADFTDMRLVHGLLAELATYFLLYTEGANLRHMPEAMWFFYWCMAHSPQMESLWASGMPEGVHPAARDRRIAVRNTFQVEISSLQQQFQHDPSAPGTIRPEECARAHAFMQGKVSDPTASSSSSSSRSSYGSGTGGTFSPEDMELFVDLIAYGDGGFWCDRVVTPVFYVLSYEMDHQVAAGEDVVFRVGYDDANESLCCVPIVYDTLLALGVTKQDARSGVVNCAHDSITRLGCPPPGSEAAAAAAAAAQEEHLAPEVGVDGAFDPQRAAAFWSGHVFTKTYLERRSWLAVYRAFYRVYALHIVLFHLLLAYAWAPNDIKIISSAVITHAACAALERFANFWMNRRQSNPLQHRDADGSWAEGAASSRGGSKSKRSRSKRASSGDAPGADHVPTPAEARATRRQLPIQGAPVWGVFGWMEWVLVFIGLTAFYVCRFVGPMTDMANAYWEFAAGGYTAMVLVHGLLTTRDGYTISLTHLLRLPALFRASSARPRATYWIDGTMKIGWKNWFLTALFWIQCFAIKIVFDYFVMLRPMVEPIRAILKRHWMECSGSTYVLLGSTTPLPCLGGSWLLIFLRVLPFFLVCIMDTHIFYQITLMSWGVVRGLCVLDVGVVGDWEALIRQFHYGPVRWWDKVMSDRGNTNRKSLVTVERAQAGCGSAGSCFETASDSDFGAGSGAIVTQRRRVSQPGADSATSGSASPHGYSSASDAYSGSDGEAAAGGGRSSATGSRFAALGRVRAGSTNGAGSERSYGDSAQGRYMSRSNSLKSWGKAAAKKGQKVTDLQLMMTGQTDEHVAMWEAFATAWDEIVDDLREADLVNNAERTNLRFTHLSYDRGLEISGVRPILLPAFFFAGQVQRVLDTGMTTPQQELVLAEVRSLAAWLGAHLGVLTQPAVDALLRASFCPEVLDLQHGASRERGVRSMVRLLGALREVGMRTVTPQDLRRRQACHAEATSALIDVLMSLEVECRAVRVAAGAGAQPPAAAAGAAGTAAADGEERSGKASKTSGSGKSKKGSKYGLGAEEVAAADELLSVCCELRDQLESDPSVLSVCLRALHDESDDCSSVGGGSATTSSCSAGGSAAASSSASTEAQLVSKVIGMLHKVLTLTPAAARPNGKEAQRILGFFMSSLGNKQLGKPVGMLDMASWSILTPCYEEDVLYPLDARAAAEQLGCAQPTGLRGGLVGGLADLLTETEDAVSLMSYLRSVFPKDWENFKERLGDELGMNLSNISEADFAPGGQLADMQLRLQLWASFRGQLLARTVRGMACYDKALRVLARLEHPRPRGVSQADYNAWVDALVESKFNHVVSAQVYARNRAARDVRNRWLAEGVDTLLEVFPRLKVAFIDAASTSRGPASYSVLIKGANSAASGGGADAAGAAAADGSRVCEVYRVRLPANLYSGRGVVIGEGKPENQNHACIFNFGEALQTIDMNQDNTVCEAFKMRNLLEELKPECTDPKALTAHALMGGARASGSDLMHALSTRTRVERPVALVGFCEWIFSDKSGALGSFAASAEFAFGTIVQRTMEYPAEVRMHYGHPDVFNKLHVMTRGGVSKATRQLHISEDVFGGYNHTLRGARIKYREYISVGKGRDMGFDSINAFEIKISGGAGEVLLSRDVWRLSTRLDLFRLLHFYHSGNGYYCNTWVLMATVYYQVFALLVFALARASVIVTEQTLPDPNNAQATIKNFDMQDTLRVEHVLQLGTLSLLPYLVELLLEYGIVKAVVVGVYQVVAGSFAFFVFKQQTTAHYFRDDVNYGGAQYIGTGRGFSITTSQFIKLYTNYARSHIYAGVELSSLAFALLAVQDCTECNYSAMTWGTWLVAGSLMFAPFWFNPLTFSLTKVKRDARAFGQWLRGEIDPETGTNWHSWNKKQLEKARNDRGAQPSHWASVLVELIAQNAPLALLTLAAVSRLSISVEVGPDLLQSPYILFIITTAIIWSALALTAVVAERLHAQARQRSWRLYGFWTAVVAVSLVVAYLAVLVRWTGGSGFANLCLIIYANANLLAMAHRTATFLAVKTPRGRALVDSGYLMFDTFVGGVLLVVLALLSCTGVVAWLQANLLFNTTFAKSIRRGQLVRTIGTAKADGVTQQLLLQQDPAAAAAAGGAGGLRSRAASLLPPHSRMHSVAVAPAHGAGAGRAAGRDEML